MLSWIQGSSLAEKWNIHARATITTRHDQYINHEHTVIKDQLQQIHSKETKDTETISLASYFNE
jgi:hypothetical protein